MEETEIMTFKDEDGNLVEFEAVARIYIEDNEYLILAPLGEDIEDEYIFRVDQNEEEDCEELNFVEDDREFEAVKKEYNRLRSQL